MKATLLTFIAALTLSAAGIAQVGIGTTSPNAASVLDLTSTTQGLLIPRLTDAQRDAVQSPAEGLVIYNTTTNIINFFNGTSWKDIDMSGSRDTSGTTETNNNVGINTPTPNPSAILDVYSTSQGLLLPDLPTGSIADVEGMLFYDNTIKALSFYNGTGWQILCGENIVSSTTGSGTGSGKAGIGTTTPHGSSVLHLEASDKGLLLPRMTTAQRDEIKPVDGLMIYNTTTKSIDLCFDSKWRRNTGSCPPLSLPSNITLEAGKVYYISSIFDADYNPYSNPTGPANTGTLAAGGGADPLIDVQGTLTTTGVQIRIPYTVVTAPVSLPAFSQTVTVPASLTQDGIARDVTLSYPAASLAVGSGYINATLQSVAGNLNAYKLDVREGLGDGSEQILVSSNGPVTDNVLGLLLANFTIAIDSAGNTGEIHLRAITCQNDVSDGTGDLAHLLYNFTGTYNTANYSWCAREITPAIEFAAHGENAHLAGKTWLDRNLGAYQIAKDGNQWDDRASYGDLYQWGRAMDGHAKRYQRTNDPYENYGTQGQMATLTTTTNSDNPLDALFITETVSPFDWRVNPDSSLWLGTAGTNNPCPSGYRLPTGTELQVFEDWLDDEADRRARAVQDTELNLPASGFRANTTGTTANVDVSGIYWGAFGTSNPSRIQFSSSNSNTAEAFRAFGFSVRCLKD